MTIAIYFDAKRKMGYPFDNPKYYAAYDMFAQLAYKENITIRIVRGKESFLGNMKFRNWWEFKDGKLQKREGIFTADIIYMKGQKITVSPTDKVLNHPELSEISSNKFKTFSYFGKYMKLSYLITRNNYADILKKITTQKLVLKPVFGSEGKGIYIVDKKDFLSSLLPRKTAYFAQEFIDGKEGIPGIMKGNHDLRLIIFNGEVKQAFLRTPQKGSYLANVAQGGTLTYVKPQYLPKSSLAIARAIDKKFLAYTPRLYTIDLMFENDKPYVIELNEQPGLPYPEEDEQNGAATFFYNELITLFKNVWANHVASNPT
jgi:hypothetical protein